MRLCHNKRWWWISFLLVMLVTVFWSLSIGVVETPWSSILMPGSEKSRGQLPAHINTIIFEIRLPRVLLALVVGAILANSGALLQGLLRNPLADPGVLGISSGSAVGAALAMLILNQLFPSVAITLGSLLVPCFAFLGGTLATWVVYRLGVTIWGISVPTMLLAGVAISSMAMAALAAINYLADDLTLRSFMYWQLGQLSGAQWWAVSTCLAVLVLQVLLIPWLGQGLNALLLGEQEAGYLGVPVEKLKRTVICVASLGVGVAVAAVGIVAFVGLVVPHIVRQCAGPNHQTLLPAVTLGGAWLLLIADTLSRWLLAPLELPIGIVTALIGAPVFIWLLIQQRQRMVS
ncbi:FecCD family ABC transporter permease [Zooshikella harenae]|uniref:Iron ABC transporter permease n=1 Tax=Zooshikella harenae TaxID=2827238 RepID=A0ABS5Z5X2_9GAMM|nr:iron ABC transporter permease [Zooshikella harenae]MBU2709446.1 iron ABC transporter permease [Zooshikella harenae]